jgi:hypothetical protein
MVEPARPTGVFARYRKAARRALEPFAVAPARRAATDVFARPADPG